MSTAPSLLRGKPPKAYPDADAFQAVVDAYFNRKDADKLPYTMHGLARALDISRTTLLQYEQYTDTPAIADAVNRARQRVAEWTEERLYSRDSHVAGPIFSLKNNFGWKDVTEHQVSVDVSIGLAAPEDVRRRLVPDIVLEQVRAPLGADVDAAPLSLPPAITLKPGESF